MERSYESQQERAMVATNNAGETAAAGRYREGAHHCNCDAFVRDVVKPRFLPEIIPTQFNYPIDIFGVWAAGRYRFMERYRSEFPHNAGEEFDAPYARVNYTGRDRFDIYWMRHTGK